MPARTVGSRRTGLGTVLAIGLIALLSSCTAPIPRSRAMRYTQTDLADCQRYTLMDPVYALEGAAKDALAGGIVGGISTFNPFVAVAGVGVGALIGLTTGSQQRLDRCLAQLDQRNLVQGNVQP